MHCPACGGNGEHTLDCYWPWVYFAAITAITVGVFTEDDVKFLKTLHIKLESAEVQFTI